MRMAAIFWIFALAEGTLAQEPAPAKKAGVTRISETLAMDFDQKAVIVEAKVVFREGPLELLLCPVRTKEHESILAAEIVPRSFQLALLGIGAVAGTPARFEPEYVAATGQEIKVEVEYERAGKQARHDAREWIRIAGDQDKRSMDAPFLFAGSRFVRAPGESRARWLGDDGDLISVANFPGSILDVGMKSDNANASLLFEAWTERIPPLGTPVRILLTPIAAPRAKDDPETK